MKLIYNFYAEYEELPYPYTVDVLEIIRAKLSLYPVNKGYTHEFYVTSKSYRIRIYKLEKPL